MLENSLQVIYSLGTTKGFPKNSKNTINFPSTLLSKGSKHFTHIVLNCPQRLQNKGVTISPGSDGETKTFMPALLCPSHPNRFGQHRLSACYAYDPWWAEQEVQRWKVSFLSQKVRKNPVGPDRCIHESSWSKAAYVKCHRKGPNTVPMLSNAQKCAKQCAKALLASH